MPACILQMMPLFQLALWPDVDFISLTRCCSRIFIVEEMDRRRGPTQSFPFTAQSFPQPFTCVPRRRGPTENKDHTRRYGPSRGWMDSLSGGTWTLRQTGRPRGGSCFFAFAHLEQELNLFRLLGSDHRSDAEDTRGMTEQDDKAGGGEYGGPALLSAPQPSPS